MFYSFKLGKILDFFLLVALGFAAFLLVNTAQSLSAVQADTEESQECLVIDPGHGGIDGGAIAFNGTKESDINLSISQKLQALAELFGVHTVMTRNDDSSRSDHASYSEHEDLVHRTELINPIFSPTIDGWLSPRPKSCISPPMCDVRPFWWNAASFPT